MTDRPDPGSPEEYGWHVEQMESWVAEAALDLEMDEEVVWHDVTVAYLTSEVDDLFLRAALARGQGIPYDVVGCTEGHDEGRPR